MMYFFKITFPIWILGLEVWNMEYYTRSVLAFQYFTSQFFIQFPYAGFAWDFLYWNLKLE